MGGEYALLGRVVLRDRIIEDGAVVIQGDTILSVGGRRELSLPEAVTDTKGKLIAPGFVDIHCHAGGEYWAYENPSKMAAYHLRCGTTGLLCTLYRDLGHQQTLQAIEKIQTAMVNQRNILGVHMEGPYLNPKYGAGAGIARVPNRAEYTEYIKSGIIRQWTFAPELDGTDAFLADIKTAGIVPAIGHSEASPERVYAVCDRGVKIVTHLANATGSSIVPTRYSGTIETSFDHAALLRDDLFYEVICDERGVHVRRDLIKLIIKTAGVDRIVGITDACTGSADGNDVNFLNGEIMGSKLTMQKVARNFLKLGLGICDIFKITSFNPACAIGVDGLTGSLDNGKLANLIVTDDRFHAVHVIPSRELILP
ncbi:MAG: amidohydrolase family protein [Clostridiales bacterium]|jgi:N-acetylglucosamine-6-phosphate deacetylase|nr:amidohydrolase family protein [Clostridiales bacterium]